MWWLIAAWAIPLAAAYACVRRCDGEGPKGITTFFLRLALAFSLGAGVSSLTYFLWLFFLGVPGIAYRVCELTLFVAIGVAAAFVRRSPSFHLGASQEALPSNERCPRWLLSAFIAALALAAIGAVGCYFSEPLGDWDAWAIWNQRARFLVRAGDHWRDAFSPIFVHADYPLLLPCSNARSWTYLGTETQWTPWLLGCAFTFATVTLLAAGVARLRSKSHGLLAGMILLGMVPFLQRGTLQYADVPLAFFMLAAVLLLAIHDTTQQRGRALLMLSGMTAGLAAWTKNEGVVFLVVLWSARAVIVWRRNGLKVAMRETAWLIVGALPALAAVAVQKTCLVGGNEFLNQQGWPDIAARLIDPTRYWLVVQEMTVHALRIARPFAVVLPLCFLFLGVTKRRLGEMPGLSTASATWLLMLAGYFFAYLTTPEDLGWHLRTSADRLLLHLCPLAILVIFLCMATPEEAAAASPGSPSP
jgi:hypothetical protein